jgi:alpha-L-rhamnosidase
MSIASTFLGKRIMPEFSRPCDAPVQLAILFLHALAIFSIFVARNVNGQQNAPLPFRSAMWIASSSGPQRDCGVYHFRRTFSLSTVPVAYRVRVSADSRFILFVNGKRVGEGPSKSDLGHWKYETFDLAHFLYPGSNVVAAVVWNFGTRAAVSQISSRTSFLLEAEDPSSGEVNTNSSWEVALDPGREPLNVDYVKLLKRYFAAPPGELLDGTRELWNWNSLDGTTKNQGERWASAIALGPPALRGAQDAATIWMLEPDTLPPMEYSTIPLGKVVRSVGIGGLHENDFPISVAPHSRATVLFDAGAVTTAYPELTLSGGRNSHVRITYAEALVDANGAKGNRNEIEGRHIVGVFDEIVTDGKEHSYSPLDWRCWRYLQLEIESDNEPLRLTRASAQFTAYPFREVGSFHSEDAALSRIWEVGWRTARLDAHDTYMDTPYWERLQYVGDTRLQALISYSISGDDRLARKAIDTFDDSRLSDGLTQSRYPTALSQIIPPYSLLWIGMVHDFWWYRNDPDFVRRHLPGTRATLAWFLSYRRPDGLLGRLPWWNFVDWTDDFVSGVPPQDPDGGSALLTLQMVAALRESAELERALGDPSYADRYEMAASKAAMTIRDRCFDAPTGLIADTPAHRDYSEQTNSLAVWLHILAPAEERSLMGKILQSESGDTKDALRAHHLSAASYYFRFYVARAMEASGFGDRYLSTLQPWKDMLALGLTTWAEQPEPSRSDSHAWSSHPNYDFLRIVAGIRPGAPGFSKVIIEPHPGNLMSFEATYPHPLGMIALSLRRTDRGVRVAIMLPANLPAVFVWAGRTYPLKSGQQVVDTGQ